jgi:hypothetical protein
MNGATPTFLHILLWRAEGQFYIFYFIRCLNCLYQINGQRRVSVRPQFRHFFFHRNNSVHLSKIWNFGSATLKYLNFIQFTLPRHNVCKPHVSLKRIYIG